MISVMSIGLLLNLSCLVDSPNYDKCFKELSDYHYELMKNPNAQEWEVSILEIHSSMWREVYKQCSSDAKASGIKNFQAIAVLDKEGFVVEHMTLPAHPELECYSRMMLGRKYPPPPVAPFYELAYKRVQ